MPRCAASCREFGVTAALHMESCVRCGLCAEACHFYVTTGDAKYTPIRKLEPFRRAYLREASPFAPLVRALGPGQEARHRRPAAMAGAALRLLHDVRPLHAGLPDGHRHRRAGEGSPPRHVQGRTGAGAAGADGPHGPAVGQHRHAGRRPARHPGRGGRRSMACEIPCDLARADILVTAAPAELGDHTKALADAAKILNRIGARWTMHQGGFDASNIGFNNGDLELQERLTRALIDTAVKIGAKTVLLPECGHAYGAARWEAAKWYGQALPVRIIHMTEFLDELIAAERIRVQPDRRDRDLPRPLPDRAPRRAGGGGAARAGGARLRADRARRTMASTAYCCGGGGGVVSNQRAAPLRHKVFEIKRQQVDATGAKRFVTSCGQCRITLEMGAKHAHWDKRDREPAGTGGRQPGRLTPQAAFIGHCTRPIDHGTPGNCCRTQPAPGVRGARPDQGLRHGRGARCTRCAASTWICATASSSSCSGRRAAASPRCSTSWAAWTRPPAAACAMRDHDLSRR